MRLIRTFAPIFQHAKLVSTKYLLFLTYMYFGVKIQTAFHAQATKCCASKSFDFPLQLFRVEQAKLRSQSNQATLLRAKQEEK